MMDQYVKETGNLKTVNELDPVENSLDFEKVGKLLRDFDPTYMDRSRPKGLDYLIIDNFLESFQDLEKTDLISARN